MLIAGVVNSKGELAAEASEALARALHPLGPVTECLHHDDPEADEDAALAIVRLAAQVGQHKPSSQIAGLLSDALGHPVLLVAEAGLQFWDWLAEQPSDGQSELAEIWQQAADSVLCRSRADGELNEDELFELEQFRRNTAASVLGYAVDVLGADLVLKLAERVIGDSPRLADSALFGLSAVAGSVMPLAASPRAPELATALLAVIGSLAPLRGERHAAAAVRFVGAYGWLLASLELEAPEQLQVFQQAMGLVASALAVGGQASTAAAASALQLSRTCKASLAAVPAVLSQFVHACTEPVWRLPEPESRAQVIEALSRMASGTAQGEALLQGLLVPLAQELGRLQQVRGPKQLCAPLDALAAMVRGWPLRGGGQTGEETHLAVRLFGPLWPGLLQLLAAAPPDEQLAHQFERLASVLMRSAGLGFLPLLPATMNAFSLQLQSPVTLPDAVRAVASAVAVYGGVTSLAADFGQVYTAACTGILTQVPSQSFLHCTVTDWHSSKATGTSRSSPLHCLNSRWLTWSLCIMTYLFTHCSQRFALESSCRGTHSSTLCSW